MEKAMFAVVVLSLYWNTGKDFSTLNVPVLSSLLFLMVLSPMCSAIIYLPGMCAWRKPVIWYRFCVLRASACRAPASCQLQAAALQIISHTDKRGAPQPCG
jgi:hypothetical protein